MEQTKVPAEVVLRSYVPRDTPESAYRQMQAYHYALVGVFLVWMFVRVFCVLGTQVYRVSDLAVALMPVEVQIGALGALICVLFAAFDLAVCYGLLTKERWGWWIALVGMFWAVVQSIGDSVISLNFGSSSMALTIHALFSVAIVLLVGWMIYLHLGPLMRTRFDVTVGSWFALGIGFTGGLVLGVSFLALVWQMMPLPVS
jgi:hypothetical protein